MHVRADTHECDLGAERASRGRREETSSTGSSTRASEPSSRVPPFRARSRRRDDAPSGQGGPYRSPSPVPCPSPDERVRPRRNSSLARDDASASRAVGRSYCALIRSGPVQRASRVTSGCCALTYVNRASIDPSLPRLPCPKRPNRPTFGGCLSVASDALLLPPPRHDRPLYPATADSMETGVRICIDVCASTGSRDMGKTFEVARSRIHSARLR